MKVFATKKGRTTIFNLPKKTKSESLKYAKELIRVYTNQIFNKRPYGWTYKAK